MTGIGVSRAPDERVGRAWLGVALDEALVSGRVDVRLSTGGRLVVIRLADVCGEAAQCGGGAPGGAGVTTTRTVWPTLQAFYDERGGERSGESDFGSWWLGERRGMPSTWARYRVSVVHDTGDVYAVDVYGGGVALLAALGSRECPGGVDHEWGCIYNLVEGLLQGWAARSDRSLSWARERLAVPA